MHNFARFSAKPGKVYFEVLVHLLIYISYNKNFCLKYYYDINDAPVSDILIQASIDTENQLTDFSDSSCQNCPDTGRSTGACIIFYQG